MSRSTTGGVGGALLSVGVVGGIGLAIWVLKGKTPTKPANEAPKPGDTPKQPGASSPARPLSVNDQRVAERLPEFVERATRLWKEGTGNEGPPSAAQLQLVAAQAWLESGIAHPTLGGWWKDAMAGSGNLGAIQCAKGDKGAAHYRCAESTDKHPDGSAYPTTFRFYRDAPAPDGSTRPAADWAMIDFLRQVSAPKRPKTFAALQSGDLHDYATALHTERYYEGFGTSVEERIAGYGKALASHLPTIASVLGQNVAVKASPASPVLAGAMDAEVIAHRLGAPRKRARRIPGTNHLIWYHPERGPQGHPLPPPPPVAPPPEKPEPPSVQIQGSASQERVPGPREPHRDRRQEWHSEERPLHPYSPEPRDPQGDPRSRHPRHEHHRQDHKERNWP